MANHLPFLPFYGRDFYDDDRVACMSYEEQGMYLRLLWHQWVNGSIPEDPAQVARVLGVPSVPEQVLACFPASDGRRLNPRLHQERKRVAAERDAKRRGGRRGRLAQLSRNGKRHLEEDGVPEDVAAEEPQPKRPGRRRQPANPAWSSRVVDTWNTVAGAAPVGPLVRALKPVHDQLQDVDRLCYGLAKWLLAGNAKFGPAVFARDWRKWVPGGRDGLPRLGRLAVEEFVAEVRREREGEVLDATE
jgi:uncharacterized protein YdaU (DUF1376 family)